ncbi:MAG: major capsid protein [Polaromonas sp.]
MATLDIFQNDAFSLSSLSQTITDLPRVPTKLGSSGLFQEYGINSLVMMIERQGSSLKLVPTAPRGGVGDVAALGPRKLIPVAGVHLPQRGSVLADEVQGIRAFGSETEVDAVSTLVKRKLKSMKDNIDLTLEYQRIGALKGQVLDADGSVLIDMYSTFGMTQLTEFFNIATASSGADVKASSRAVSRKIRTALGGRAFTGIRAEVSEDFFDKLTGNNDLKTAWKDWQAGQYLREQQNEDNFSFAGITYSVYGGGTDGADFIASGTGYAYPVGLPGMFQTAYCPADYMETVNTNGIPYYVKQEAMAFGKGISMEAQSNPLMLNTLPEVVIKLSAAAS